MRWIVVAGSAALASACVATTTQLAPVAPEAVAAEEVAQRELVISELDEAQQRLDDLAFALLASATPLCQDRLAPRLGLSLRTVNEYEGVWVEAARAALSLSDTLTVTSVASGSPAERAGVAVGDKVIAIDDVAIPPGEDALDVASEVLEAAGSKLVRLNVHRSGTAQRLEIQPATVCDFDAVVVVEGDINAFADGERVIFPWAMMRFAADDELVGVLAHEIAHNAMGHLDAVKSNALLGGLLGAVFDVALATQGVNTGGENTANFMSVGAQAFSQDFEREADYVGMYILARAGVPLETVPNLWRQFAQINPSAISYASTHPTTAERFVRLRQTIDEIRRKRAAGEELLPEMKPGG